VAYNVVAIGFVTTFIALEAAWHFTACKVKDKSIKPCYYVTSSSSEPHDLQIVSVIQIAVHLILALECLLSSI